MENRITSKSLFVTIFILIVLASITAIAKSRWWAQPAKASPNLTTTDPAPSTPIATQVPSGDRAEAELVQLTIKGFEPAEITRPAGKFLLNVTNRTGLPELSLRLTHESQRSVAGKRLGREMNWHKVIDLPPGRYALREASHSDWVCRITIGAR